MGLFDGAGVPTPDAGGLVQRWKSWLDSDPANRAALMQFGLSLTQPPSFGDNTISQVGRAIGSAGEAQSRVAAQEQKQQESESRQTLQAAQADSALTRAQAAKSWAGAAAENRSLRNALDMEKLGIARERLAAQQSQGSLQRKIQASNAYNAYVKQKQTQDSSAALVNPDFRPDRLLTPQEFYTRHGFGDLLEGKTPQAPATDGQEAPRGLGTTETPAQYPDARKAPDGNWYVLRNGKYFRVER